MQERVGKFLAGLTSRKDEVRRRCRTVLQSRAERLPRNLRPGSQNLKMHIPPWLNSLSHKATNGLPGDWRCGKFIGYGCKGNWSGSATG